MNDKRADVLVTIPVLNIEQRHAALVKMAPKRFLVWWESDGNKNEHLLQYINPDLNVPNEMIILEDE